jgi:hypothetical protein
MYIFVTFSVIPVCRTRRYVYTDYTLALSFNLLAYFLFTPTT